MLFHFSILFINVYRSQYQNVPSWQPGPRPNSRYHLNFFFNVFIVARPAAQPFPILESQTIQKAKRQWITSFNFFVLFELAGWPNCCPAATSCWCPAAASSSSCCQEYPGHKTLLYSIHWSYLTSPAGAIATCPPRSRGGWFIFLFVKAPAALYWQAAKALPVRTSQGGLTPKFPPSSVVDHLAHPWKPLPVNHLAHPGGPELLWPLPRGHPHQNLLPQQQRGGVQGKPRVGPTDGCCWQAPSWGTTWVQPDATLPQWRPYAPQLSRHLQACARDGWDHEVHSPIGQPAPSRCGNPSSHLPGWCLLLFRYFFKKYIIFFMTCTYLEFSSEHPVLWFMHCRFFHEHPVLCCMHCTFFLSTQCCWLLLGIHFFGEHSVLLIAAWDLGFFMSINVLWFMFEFFSTALCEFDCFLALVFWEHSVLCVQISVVYQCFDSWPMICMKTLCQ